MFLRVFIFMVLSIFTLKSYSQSFTLADTSFKPGTYFRFYYAINLDHGACTVYPCYEYNKKVYDSLVHFLNIHPTFKIEIGAHNDGLAPDPIPFSWTKSEAQGMKGVLISLGIDEKRASAKGYENTKPIISSDEMSKLNQEE